MKKLTILIKKVLDTVLSALLFLSILSIGASPVSAATVPASVSIDQTGTSFDLRVNYGPAANISAGDTIEIRLSVDASSIIKIVGFGGTDAPIFGTVLGGTTAEVGTRTYSYDGDTCILSVEFNGAYTGLSAISGWYSAGANLEYKASTSERIANVKVEINGSGSFSTVPITVPAGGPGTRPSEPDFSAGNQFGKNWRYGDTDGNGGGQFTLDGDFTQFAEMRWFVTAGYNNLTNRDMRANYFATEATKGYWTTAASLAYSNANPMTPASPFHIYNSTTEPYLAYRYWGGGIWNVIPVNEPFHYDNVVLDDFLDVGIHYINQFCSTHDYIAESIRIVRIIGREANDQANFREIADSNFLIPHDGRNINQIYRNFKNTIFDGNRGLTLPEFFAQMKSEGQFAGYSDWTQIITFDMVDNNETPPSSIPHFELKLGDLHFSDTYTGTVTGICRDNTTSAVIHNVPAKNLPFAYLIYYDTHATDADLNGGVNYNYFNRATLSYAGGSTITDYNPLWVRREASGGSGIQYASLKIKKTDAQGNPVQGVEFTLTKDSDLQIKNTNVNGELTFYIGSDGNYSLIESLPEGLDLIAMEPITFEVFSTDRALGTIDLTYYKGNNDISFDDTTEVNTIVNKASGGTPPPPEPAELTLRGIKTLTDLSPSVPLDITTSIEADQFRFLLEIEGDPGDDVVSWDGSSPVSVSAGGGIDFGTLTFYKEGTYEIAISEDNLGENGYGYDSGIFVVMVDVEDVLGQLVASERYYTHPGVDAGGISFENTYWPGAVTMTLEGTKSLTNPRSGNPQNIEAEEFSFELIADTNSDAGDATAWAWSGENPVDVLHGGDINFGTLTFGDAGTYVFTLKEVLPSPIPTDWEYDTEEVTVTVEVIVNTQGELEITDVAYEKDGIPVDDILFENTHAYAEGVHVPIDVSKSANASMQAGQFTFSLYASNNSRSQGELSQTKANASAGTDSAVVFDPLYFNTRGTYHYLLGETGGSSARWSLDPTRYAIEIEIIDDGHSGYLTYEVRYEKRVEGLWEPSEAPTFYNTYTPPRYNPDDDSSGTGDTGGGTPTPPTSTVTVTPPATEPIRTELTDEGSQATVQVVEDTGGQQPYLQGGRNHDEPPMATILGHELVQDGDGYLEFDDNGVALGRWSWDDGEEQWIYDEFPPLASLPPTGDNSFPTYYSIIFGFTIVAIGMMLLRRKAYEARH